MGFYRPCSLWKASLAIVAFSASLGCRQSDSDPQAGTSKLTWPDGVPPFPLDVVIVDYHVTNQRNVQRRELSCITAGPIDQTTIDPLMQKLYDRLKFEIEATDPRAATKSVGLILGTCELDLRHGNAIARCSLDASSAEGAVPLPGNWKDMGARVEQRDLATRPSRLQEQIELDYLTWREEFRQSAVYTHVEKTREALNEIETSKVAQKYGLTGAEVIRNHHRWRIWWSGQPATETAINERIASGILDVEL